MSVNRKVTVPLGSSAISDWYYACPAALSSDALSHLDASRPLVLTRRGATMRGSYGDDTAPLLHTKPAKDERLSVLRFNSCPNVCPTGLT